jgi:hypothetical protein
MTNNKGANNGSYSNANKLKEVLKKQLQKYQFFNEKARNYISEAEWIKVRNSLAELVEKQRKEMRK